MNDSTSRHQRLLSYIVILTLCMKTYCIKDFCDYFVLTQKFQAQLRSRLPQIERITQLADEILAACHPNAVRFVRYYLTITQTRWKQAVYRSEQRAARLQDALMVARGSAALVDELLTWVTEAHALLTAKDKDAVPDDLTVVESLLHQHLVSN